jgi:hypothetical protein
MKTIRDKTWPTVTPLSIKLYGSMQDLKATASFVSLSGLALLFPANEKKIFACKSND